MCSPQGKHGTPKRKRFISSPNSALFMQTQATPAWLIDNTPTSHKIVRILLFLTSFTWSINPIQDFMADAPPIEKILTRMVPMLVVAGYCVRDKHRDRIKLLFRPGMMPLMWYVLCGVIGGFTGIVPSLSCWKGAEILITLMWMSVFCHDDDSIRREFVAYVKYTEIMLGATVILAFMNPSLGFLPSASIIPWIRGYYPNINPNTLGFLSVYTLARLLFLPSKYKIPRTALASFTLLCAQSRTSYAVTGIMLCFFIIDGFRNRQLVRDFIAMAFALLALFIALGWLDSIVKVFMRGQTSEELSSLSGRTDYWRFTLKHVSWLGQGLATGARSLTFLSSSVFASGLVGTHNSFVEALIDTGYIGAVPFIFMLAFNCIRQLLKTFSRATAFDFLMGSCACAFVERAMTSMALALFSYDFVILMFFMTWQYTSNRPIPMPKTRPKPVVYEKTLHEMAQEKAS